MTEASTIYEAQARRRESQIRALGYRRKLALSRAVPHVKAQPLALAEWRIVHGNHIQEWCVWDGLRFLRDLEGYQRFWRKEATAQAWADFWNAAREYYGLPA